MKFPLFLAFLISALKSSLLSIRTRQVSGDLDFEQQLEAALFKRSLDIDRNQKRSEVLSTGDDI